MKKNKTFFIFSIFLFCITIVFWIDIYNQNQLIKYEKLNNQQVVCLEKLKFYSFLIDSLAKKENYKKKDIVSFFTYKNNEYLKKVDRTNFLFKPVLEQSDKENLEFDTILKLKSYRIFFLFRNNTYVGNITGCDFDATSQQVSIYLENRGEYQTIE
ncbi:MAG: hypothetical protein ACQEQ0_03905 [Bacteroidota bacterium]